VEMDAKFTLYGQLFTFFSHFGGMEHQSFQKVVIRASPNFCLAKFYGSATNAQFMLISKLLKIYKKNKTFEKQ
jgi:hypothetical protein